MTVTALPDPAHLASDARYGFVNFMPSNSLEKSLGCRSFVWSHTDEDFSSNHLTAVQLAGTTNVFEKLEGASSAPEHINEDARVNEGDHENI
ncbi:MAG: hypothetical protein WCK25_04800 [Actinomycetes bacterium]